MLTPAFLRRRGIGAVLFDKDGTLIDSLEPWAEAEKALCEALVSRHVPGPADRAELVSLMLADLGIVDGTVSRGGILATGTSPAVLLSMLRALERATETRLDPESFSAEAVELLFRLYPGGGPESRPMAGADRLLSTLREAGFPLGLATSDDHDRTMAELGNFGWFDHFSFVACGDTALEPKPSPWSVREFARVVGVPCARIAVVGDTETDRKMAADAGAGLFELVTDGFDLLW